MNAVLVLCFLGVACAAYAVPTPSFLDSVSDCYDNMDNIYRYNIYNSGRGVYKFGFEQPDGTKQEQEGQLISKGGEQFLSVKGSFSYIGKDGIPYTVKYVADDNGFKPEIEQGPGGSVPDAVVASMLG